MHCGTCKHFEGTEAVFGELKGGHCALRLPPWLERTLNGLSDMPVRSWAYDYETCAFYTPVLPE